MSGALTAILLNSLMMAFMPLQAVMVDVWVGCELRVRVKFGKKRDEDFERGVGLEKPVCWWVQSQRWGWKMSGGV